MCIYLGMYTSVMQTQQLLKSPCISEQHKFTDAWFWGRRRQSLNKLHQSHLSFKIWLFSKRAGGWVDTRGQSELKQYPGVVEPAQRPLYYNMVTSMIYLGILRHLCVCLSLSCVLCDPVDCSPPGSSVLGDSPGENTGVGCHVLLQVVFLTQGLNLRLLRLLHW